MTGTPPDHRDADHDGGAIATPSARLDRELAAIQRASRFTTILVLVMLGAGVLLGGLAEAVNRIRANGAALLLLWAVPAAIGGAFGVATGRAALARLDLPDDETRAVARMAGVNRFLSALLVTVFLVIVVVFFAGYQLREQGADLALLDGISAAFLIVWLLDGFVSGQHLVAGYVGNRALRRQKGEDHAR